MSILVTKEDIVQWFEIESNELDGVELLFGYYEQGGYEGAAFVLFTKDGKLYEVNGLHCSCYALEGQWSPEETSVDALMVRLNEGRGFYLGNTKDLRESLDKLK